MASKIKTVADVLAELDEYEAWRPALIAFYRADCWFQSAENIEAGYPLGPQDRRVIDSLRAAFEVKAA